MLGSKVEMGNIYWGRDQVPSLPFTFSDTFSVWKKGLEGVCASFFVGLEGFGARTVSCEAEGVRWWCMSVNLLSVCQVLR
jgi:hypothetical protein